MRLNGCREIPHAQWSGRFGNTGKATQNERTPKLHSEP